MGALERDDAILGVGEGRDDIMTGNTVALKGSVWQ